MKLYDVGATALIIVAIAILIGFASNKIIKMEEDNIVEEIAEEIVESQTGLDLDFTPDSPELEKA